MGHHFTIYSLFIEIFYRALHKREYLMIIFLISHRNHMLHDPSSEQSQRDSSDEGTQHMFLYRINKNCHQILPLT